MNLKEGVNMNYFEGKNILSIHVVPLHKNLMNLLFLLLVLILAGRLESSMLNFEMIGNKEFESISSNTMPNISTSSNVSREIGVGPEPANRSLYGIAAAGSSSAIVARPTTSNSFVDSYIISKLFEFFPQDSTAEAEIPSATPQNEMHSSGNSFDCRSSSALSSQASNNHARRLVVPNFQPSSGPSPTSLQLPNTLSGSLNNERVPKRAREEAPIDPETQIYIDREVKMTQIRRPEKIDALRKVIELIARNDYEGFKDHEPVFKELFNNVDRYRMFHYIIRFGAANFLRSPFFLKYSTESSHNSKLKAAFDHLIKTKTFNAAIQFIFSYRFNGSVTKIISAAIKARYPSIHFLDLAVFECDHLVSPIIVTEFYKSIQIENEQEKLIHFTKCLKKNSAALLRKSHYSHARYVEAFFKFSEYFLSVDIDIRILIAKFAILNRQIDCLTKIIELDPFILTSVKLFTFATRCQFTESLKLFMEIIPEYATLESGEPSPIAWSIMIDSLIKIKVFYECGFDFTKEIEYISKMITPILLAFKLKSLDVFGFFIRKFGKEMVLAELLKVHGTECEIIKEASKFSSSKNEEILSILKNRLGISLTFFDKKNI
jgi:hypothetical protein